VLNEILTSDDTRRRLFPVAAVGPYLGHAGIAPICGPAADAIRALADAAARGNQENPDTAGMVARTRKGIAQLINADADEISLLGPTSLGLNLVAKGLDWNPGDEVVFHADDYPANVYPWRDLERHGVKPVAFLPDTPGIITWETLAPHLTANTRLVALASCHYLTGYRIDIDGIGERLRERGILFCLDAIQTTGAFPTEMTHVDFAAADSHKWMLGPVGAGFFFVSKRVRDRLRPALLGALNVQSPDFIAQDAIAFEPGPSRYEPGTLNLPGIAGMGAAVELILEIGIDAVAQRLLALREHILREAAALGYTPYPDPRAAEPGASGIVTLAHPDKDLEAVHRACLERDIVCSLRANRAGQPMLRLSPHAYTTEAELHQAFRVLAT